MDNVLQWHVMLAAAGQCLAPAVLAFAGLGVGTGVLIGALPGLGPIMAMTIVLPLTFHLSPESAMAMLLGIFCGSLFGGSISSVLLGTPGTAAAVATMWDGYPLARKGQAVRAIRLALFASVCGGILSALISLVFSPQLSRLALLMGPSENAAVVLLGMTTVLAISSGNLNKGILAACLGMLLGTVGLDPESAAPRMTFGLAALENGIHLVAMVMGLFGMTEILARITPSPSSAAETAPHMAPAEAETAWSAVRDCVEGRRTLLRSSLIGTIIGVIPGTGAAIAAFVGYDRAKKTSPRGMAFGKGCPEGVLAAEAANSAVTSGSMVPLLALGIPGSAAVAVMLGALTVHGLDPGPSLFVHHLDFVYFIFLSIMLANLIMLVLVQWTLPLFAQIVRIPDAVIRPVIVVLILIGCYAIEGNLSHIWQMLFFAATGLALRSFAVPLPPLVICFILTPLLETYTRQAFSLVGGDALEILKRPWTSAMLLACLCIVIAQLGGRRRGKIRSAPETR